MPESRTPNRISQPHTLTSCEPSFCLGRIVSASVGGLFCAIIIYIAVVYYISLYILYAIV